MAEKKTQGGKNIPWWKKTTIYQIYPRSFKDSTGNGIGDLLGIISKLDYIKDLGVETIWFSPFYSSPQADFGYDISDYQNIAPEYGTMEDFDDLVKINKVVKMLDKPMKKLVENTKGKNTVIVVRVAAKIDRQTSFVP